MTFDPATLSETDEYILKKACNGYLCCNVRERGYVFCIECLHGPPEKLNEKYVARKRELDTLMRIKDPNTGNWKVPYRG